MQEFFSHHVFLKFSPCQERQNGGSVSLLEKILGLKDILGTKEFWVHKVKFSRHNSTFEAYFNKVISVRDQQSY